jgi:hypothetical protein
MASLPIFAQSIQHSNNSEFRELGIWENHEHCVLGNLEDPERKRAMKKSQD